MFSISCFANLYIKSLARKLAADKDKLKPDNHPVIEVNCYRGTQRKAETFPGPLSANSRLCQQAGVNFNRIATHLGGRERGGDVAAGIAS